MSREDLESQTKRDVAKVKQQSTGFGAFNAFRLMIAPMFIRIIWLLGAYIVYPIALFYILDLMSKNRYTTSEDMWKVVGISIGYLIVFRLLLESLIAIFRIHESTTKTTELLERLLHIEERRQSGDAVKAGE